MNTMSDMKNDGVNKESLFYKTLSSIGDLSLNFLVGDYGGNERSLKKINDCNIG